LLLGEEHVRGWRNFYGPKRGQLEIMAEVLMRCRTAKAKTRIMYENNLSYGQLRNILKLLLSRRLLELEDTNYVTTDKGLDYVEQFAGINALLSDSLREA
jgi:predicted transcriptional regulator